ncbi:ejaculatory bulb-specific protein 3-like [Harmonia axyridis]|uniref:ejaculatory bulb-specific protein 3-like n=1 Tax=Harmonia axyridis TaxID=115357 RepID=UPI001E275ED3|nr:ejaculatory bulb-specific protein 3-like [Harmonia axyridis]
MKLLLLFVFAAAATTVYCDLKDVDKTLAKIDFEAVRASGRLLENMFNCLIDGVRCTPDAKELRKFLPEILETCCAECTEKLYGETKRMVDFLHKYKPEYGKRALDKFDPDGTLVGKCDAAFQAKGINLSGFRM